MVKKQVPQSLCEPLSKTPVLDLHGTVFALNPQTLFQSSDFYKMSLPINT